MDVLDRMGQPSHPEEDHLERYVMKTCSEQETEVIEEHLLVCEQCRARLYEAEEWVSLMKSAIPLGPMPPQRVPRWRRAMEQIFAQPLGFAAGCAALAALLLAAPVLLRTSTPEEQLVTLTATTRGAGDSSVAALDSRRLARIRVDTTGLDQAVEGQVVDSQGVALAAPTPIAPGKEIRLDRPLRSGVYWVRLYSTEGDRRMLREFQLVVK